MMPAAGSEGAGKKHGGRHAVTPALPQQAGPPLTTRIDPAPILVVQAASVAHAVHPLAPPRNLEPSGRGKQKQLVLPFQVALNPC